MQGAADSGGGSVLWRHVTAAAARRATSSDPRASPLAPWVPPARTPDRMIAAAIGRAAEHVHGLPLFFDRVELGQAGLAELAELFPDRPLISVIEGPMASLGVVAICPGLLSSLIEMQATGRVSSRVAPPRRPTRADGAISADFINACLAELGGDLAALPGFEGMRGFRYASFLDDPRPLQLMLEEVSFHLISVRLRAGDAGQRDGTLIVVLPMTTAPAQVPAIETEALPQQGPSETGMEGSLAQAVRAVPLDLVGVLCRRGISLGELRALSPGDTIALPSDALGAATLETAAGQVLFRGKLGELAGRHALRLLGSGPGAPKRMRDAELAGTGGQSAERLHELPIADLAEPDPFRLRESGGVLPLDMEAAREAQSSA